MSRLSKLYFFNQTCKVKIVIFKRGRERGRERERERERERCGMQPAGIQARECERENSYFKCKNVKKYRNKKVWCVF